MKDKGLSSIKPRPTAPTPTTALPSLPTTDLLPRIAEIKDAVTKVAEDNGLTVRVEKDAVVVLSVDKKIGLVKLESNPKMIGVEMISTGTGKDTATLELMVKVMQAAGIPVDDSFADTLNGAIKTRQNSTLIAGKYSLSVEPSTKLYKDISIHIRY
ncbi:hypothetical protein [Paenibacillus agricola]|uniref:Uncharacterized protein n=1 Tax=Paenibacillus agricola TaxID=2716264 RepID=A0ABX0JEB1_9BACL|nr:hypothetical protein [Paenibacillus agricola]NHN34865.1 hypothetical protein [Paenibacillus agricola]